MTVIIREGTAQRSVAAHEGENARALLTRLGIYVDAPCGGRGTCGKCAVKTGGAPVSDHDATLLDAKRLAEGWRLACKLACFDGLALEVAASGAVVLTDGAGAQTPLNPSAGDVRVSVDKTSIEDQLGDDERVGGAAGAELPLDVVAALPDVLREGGYSIVVRRVGGIARRVMAGERPLLGVAVDIGTTTVAAYLMDLKDGAQLDVLSALNPQRSFGADVITRTDAAATPEGLKSLGDAIRGCINGMLEGFAARRGVDVQDIAHITIAGNTIMTHLFAGITPRHIAVSPFIPALTALKTVRASEVGLCATFADVTLLPAVAGYVGADTVAAVAASGMGASDGLSLLIDIGTNGEIVLGGRDGMLCCSTAAGPAFEGAHIACGMGGVEGAISRVSMDGQGVSLEVIGGGAPRGICGSGLVDAVAGLLGLGVVDCTGRFDADVGHPLLGEWDGKPVFNLAEGVYLSQRDLREVQLAKGAIAVGIDVLLAERGASYDDVDTVFLAGGFGSYIDYDAACAIGLLPMPLRGKIQAMGNGAGAGARMALLSKDVLEGMTALRDAMRYVELSTRADFNDLFVERMMFE